jgi:hypothetical protein
VLISSFESRKLVAANHGLECDQLRDSKAARATATDVSR